MPDSNQYHHRPSDSPLGEWAWDRRYAEHPWPNEPDSTLIEFVSALSPGKALDLGCGPGRNAIWLARQGWDVTGVDASVVGLAQAEARAAGSGVTLRLIAGDILAYQPPAAQFDLIVLANIHLAPEQRSPFFLSLASALAPGGHLFVTGHHLESLGRAGPPDPERLYTEERLADLFPTLHVEHLGRHEKERPNEHPLVDIVVWATRTA